MNKSNGQIFITGCYRSGTEYTSQLIGNQPRVSVMFDINFLRYCYNRFDPVSERWKEVLIYMDATIRKRIGRKLKLNTLFRETESSSNVSYWSLYDLVMRDLCFRKKQDIWADKTQLAWRLIPDVLDNFPNGKAVIIIREPKAVLASFKKHTYAKFPLHLGAIFNCYDAMKHAEIYTQQYPERCYKLQYEKVVREPEETLISVFDFLGLEYGHDLLSQVGWKKPDGTKWEDNTSWKGLFDVEKSAKKWETVLEDWEKSMCDKVNREYYAVNGYEPAYICEDMDMPRNVIENKTVQRYVKDWLFRGVGIQEFPTDPLKEENWTVNR